MACAPSKANDKAPAGRDIAAVNIYIMLRRLLELGTYEKDLCG